MKREGRPKKGELVIIRIKRIMDYGSIAKLVEYKDREGFIHISNITKSWVKNIRSHISEGGTRVAEVVKVNKNKDTVNLSLKDVSDSQKRRKMQTWKREKRTDKIIGKLAEEMDEDPEEAKKEIIPKLVKEYVDAFTVFEEASSYGEEALEDLDISEDWKEKILEYAEENIKPPEVSIEGKITIEVDEGDGIDIIRKALVSASDQDDVEITYLSAPEYRIKVKEKDYKKAEEKIKEAKKRIKDEAGEKARVGFQRKD